MIRRLVPGAAAALVLVFVVLPLAVLFREILASPGTTLAALSHPLHVRAALDTLRLTAQVGLVALALGVPLGWLLGRTDLPGRAVWRTLATLPLVVPPYVTAIAWIALANPTTGLLNRLLVPLGVPSLDIYGLGGMTWVLGLAFTPFVLVATADALGRADPSLEEQARLCGAGPWRAIATVTLPLAAPGIVAGLSFVVAATAAAFGVPYLLASGTSTPRFVLTTRIYQVLDLDPAAGRPAAVALALVLLALGVGLPALLGRLQGRRRFAAIGGRAASSAPFALGRARPGATAFVAAYVGLAVVLPLGTIGVTSLLVSFGRGLGPGNLTLANYRDVLLGRSDTLDALATSLGLAASAATVAVALGALLAWSAARTAGPVDRAARRLAHLPYAVPGTVLALALLLTFSREIRLVVLERLTVALALADTAWMLGVAYVVKFLAFPTGSSEAALATLDPSLEESARTSGAGWATTLRTVTIPLLRPALVSAWFLVFVAAFSEVTMSILLVGPGTRVVGTLLFELQSYGDPPSAAVVAVVLTAIVLAATLLVRGTSRGRLGL